MELFDDQIHAVQQQAEALAAAIDQVPMPQKVRALNAAREALHEVSPFKGQPIDCVLWVENDRLEGNNYNPNAVAPPEMKLLKRSIDADGYTQPIVTWSEGGDSFEVVDGEHRTRTGREYEDIAKRLHGYLPITQVKDDQGDRKNRMAATIRHNRARGVHGVGPMTEIVAELIRQGWSDGEVAAELGMDADEVLRFKHATGLPELFADEEYSSAWE